MMDMLYIVMGIAWVLVSFVAYYWVGKLLGGLAYGKVITACVIVLLWMFNSIVNAGGLTWLLWLIRRVPGFGIGMLGVLVPMELVAMRGVSNHLVLGKMKWLM